MPLQCVTLELSEPNRLPEGTTRIVQYDIGDFD